MALERHIPGDNEGIYPPNQHLTASSMFYRPSPSTISITLRAQIQGKIHLVEDTWIIYIPGLIIIYYVNVCSNMLNSVTVWYLLCWSAELITQCNGCLDDFTPRQTLGSMKTTCFFYLPNSDYVTLANTIDIWTKWILNKALPTFFCFSLPQYLRTLALSFCVYSNRWLQWMHATLHY